MPKKEKHYRPVSMYQRWGKLPPHVRRAAVWAGAITTITGAIVGMSRALPVVEPYWPAHRMYVRDRVDFARDEFKATENSNTLILRDLQIEQAEGKRDAVKNDLAKWAVELNKTQDPQTRQLIEKTINEQNATYERLQEQLRSLNKLRALVH